MTMISTRLLLNRRHIAAASLPAISPLAAKLASPSLISGDASNFHTSTSLQRPGWKPERNPKIGITLEQLRMAARGNRRRLPICHEEQEKVMNALEAAKYEVCLRVWVHCAWGGAVLLIATVYVVFTLTYFIF